MKYLFSSSGCSLGRFRSIPICEIDFFALLLHAPRSSRLLRLLFAIRPSSFIRRSSRIAPIRISLAIDIRRHYSRFLPFYSCGICVQVVNTFCDCFFPGSQTFFPRRIERKKIRYGKKSSKQMCINLALSMRGRGRAREGEKRKNAGTNKGENNRVDKRRGEKRKGKMMIIN